MKNVKNMVLGAFFIGLGLVLPFLTMQIPEIGKALSPMHISVHLGGFVLGGPWGALVGVVTPLLRSVIFGMPMMFPEAIAMAFELGTYGFCEGVLNRTFKFKSGLLNIYVSLVVSMLAGRAVYGIAKWLLLMGSSSPYTMQLFLAGAFVNAVPGIILHLLLIPAVMLVLKKAKLVPLK